MIFRLNKLDRTSMNVVGDGKVGPQKWNVFFHLHLLCTNPGLTKPFNLMSPSAEQ